MDLEEVMMMTLVSADLLISVDLVAVEVETEVVVEGVAMGARGGEYISLKNDV